MANSSMLDIDLASMAWQAQVPQGQRVYAVGDVHGQRDLLAGLVELIEVDRSTAAPAEETVVFLGDYVDRGAHSKAVIDLLVAGPVADARCVFLCGNHDQAMLDFLNDPKALGEWLKLGGEATLAAYGVALLNGKGKPRTEHAVRGKLLQALPRDHRTFLDELRLHVRIGDYLFVHAGLRPGVPLERQSPADLISIREPFLSFRGRHGALVVHGHTRVDMPEEHSNRIAIDTGAYKTGRLTCLVLEGGERRYISTTG